MSTMLFTTLAAADNANALITYAMNLSGTITVQWGLPRVRTNDSKAVLIKPDDRYLLYTREDGSQGPISEIVGAYTIE